MRDSTPPFARRIVRDTKFTVVAGLLFGAILSALAFDHEGFQTADELFVTLEGRAAAKFGLRMEILPLAALVLAYWENWFAADASTS